MTVPEPPPPPSYDPETLRESYPDQAQARTRADDLRRDVRTAPDDVGELVARGDLVELLRALGELDDALAEARRAADRAEIAGTTAQQHLARLRLAHVHQDRGEFPDANLIFTELLAVADEFGPVIEAFTHQHIGQNDYAQGHFADAAARFERAVAIRTELEVPELAASQVALAAAQRHLADPS